MRVLDTDEKIGSCEDCGAVGGVVIEIDTPEETAILEICPDCYLKRKEK